MLAAPQFSGFGPFPLSRPPDPGTVRQHLGGVPLTATLQAFEQAGVSRVLAEPTLTAISGESAKFTAGGEIPVPKSESCSSLGRPTILRHRRQFKPYGVTLTLRRGARRGPDLLAVSGPRSRKSTPKLQTLGSIGQTSPFRGMKVRKSETTVELPSGAVMMTAGLIQQSTTRRSTGFPAS